MVMGQCDVSCQTDLTVADLQSLTTKLHESVDTASKLQAKLDNKEKLQQDLFMECVLKDDASKLLILTRKSIGVERVVPQ